MKDNETKLIRLWDRYRPLWHIVTFIILVAFSGGIVWAQYQNVNPRLTTLEAFQMNTMVSIAEMKQNLQDLHDWYAKDNGKKQ